MFEKTKEFIAKAFVPVSEQEAPHLHAAVDELCAKAGIAKPKVCFVDPAVLSGMVKEKKMSRLSEYLLNRTAQVMHLDEPRLILGERLREIMGHATPGAEINEEFKAVLAHEIGHLKRGDVKLYKVLPLNNAPYIGAAAATGGVWLYEHLQGKKTAMKEAGASEEAVHQALHKEWQNSDQPQTNIAGIDQPAKLAKYVAGALMGFGVGFGVYALGHHASEFGADKVSAELMGSGKPLANALRTVVEGLKADIEKSPEIIAEAQKQPFLRKLFAQYTHPADMSRIARLESWVR